MTSLHEVMAEALVAIAAFVSFDIDSSSFIEYKGSTVMQLDEVLPDIAMVSLVLEANYSEELFW